MVGYPLWLNVSTWELEDIVSVGSESGIIESELSIYRLQCWKVVLSEDVQVYYIKDWGIFARYHWSQAGSTGWMQMWIESEEYSLTSENIDAFDAVNVTTDGWLTMGIIVQFAFFLVIVEYRRSRTEVV